MEQEVRPSAESEIGAEGGSGGGGRGGECRRLEVRGAGMK